MQYEHVFSISGATAKPLTPTDMAAAGFLERQHLEEWLIEHPHVVGDDVMIVTSEYDRWQNSVGDPRKDRIDILGIDSGGNLVIIELKRDAASSDVDLQALKYAALVSRFSDDTLIDAHQRFLSKRRGQSISAEEAKAALEDHVDGPLDAEAWTQPTVVLVANSFPDTVTNTVVWLSEAGLDMQLLRYQMYATADDPLLVVSQIYPVPDTEEFLLAPRREEVQQAKEKTRAKQRQRDVVKVLVEAGEPEIGTALHLEPSGINEDLREQMTEWLAEDPARGEQHGPATFPNRSTGPTTTKGESHPPSPAKLWRRRLASSGRSMVHVGGGSRTARVSPSWRNSTAGSGGDVTGAISTAFSTAFHPTVGPHMATSPRSSEPLHSLWASI